MSTRRFARRHWPLMERLLAATTASVCSSDSGELVGLSAADEGRSSPSLLSNETGETGSLFSICSHFWADVSAVSPPLVSSRSLPMPSLAGLGGGAGSLRGCLGGLTTFRAALPFGLAGADSWSLPLPTFKSFRSSEEAPLTAFELAVALNALPWRSFPSWGAGSGDGEDPNSESVPKDCLRWRRLVCDVPSWCTPNVRLMIDSIASRTC
mmetsp:Transcript_59450/g.112101  ORF Transcript_59450/g.112101 Transcript_59450/m.112101 type:complete len:210 (+) Transcript_59450:2717-3346(+)